MSKRITKTKLHLECMLTDNEKLVYSKDLAENISLKARVEDNLDSFKAQAKAEIQGHDAKINLLSEKVRSGKEYRMVDCDIHYDWNTKEKIYSRKDTGEIVKTDIIPEEDLQEYMFEQQDAAKEAEKKEEEQNMAMEDINER